MGLVYACPNCNGQMVLRPRHRGHDVPCPECGDAVEVPRGLSFRRLSKANIADRRVAGWSLFWAYLACALWLPPITAYVWWRMQGLLRRARDEGRDVVEDVRAARIVAVVGLLAQISYYAKVAVNVF